MQNDWLFPASSHGLRVINILIYYIQQQLQGKEVKGSRTKQASGGKAGWRRECRLEQVRVSTGGTDQAGSGYNSSGCTDKMLKYWMDS